MNFTKPSTEKQALFYKYFDLPYGGIVTHNAEHDLYHVQGDVSMTAHMSPGHLPIKFHEVTGNFEAIGCKLTTLEGAPVHVENMLRLYRNQLTSLAHMPQSVGMDMDVSMNPLKSLAHITPDVGGDVTVPWMPDLPLLRLLMYHPRQIYLMSNDFLNVIRIEQTQEIIRKWAGKGKTNMLNCALGLKKAGFEGNAKW